MIKLNERSEKNLVGVHADLVRIVRRAAELSKLQFVVTEGLRTLERQRQLMAAGATRTLNSRHLDGHAVDLAAVVDGEVRWDWPLYCQLAQSMQMASHDTGVPVEWGGVWDRPLDKLSPNLNVEMVAYCARHVGRDFCDGPHFQLPFSAYPAVTQA